MKNLCKRNKKKNAPLLDLSLLLFLLFFVSFWVLDSDNCMLAKQLDFSFRHYLYVLSISILQRFFNANMYKKSFCSSNQSERERKTNSRTKSTSKTKKSTWFMRHNDVTLYRETLKRKTHWKRNAWLNP